MSEANMAQSQRVGALAVVISATGFAIMPLFARIAYGAGMSVTTLLVSRFVIAGGLLLLYLAIRKQLRWPGWSTFGWLALAGGGLYTAQAMFFFTAVRRIDASITVLLLYLYPGFVIALSALLRRMWPSLQHVVALVVSLIGLVLVVGTPTKPLDTVGVLCGIGAAVSYSFYIIVGQWISGRTTSMMSTAIVCSCAAVSTLVIGLTTRTLSLDVRPLAWAGVAGVTVISTMIAIGCMLAGIAIIGAERASLVSMVEPVVGVVLAASFLGERFTVWQMLGAVAVVAAAVYGARVKSRRDAIPSPGEMPA